MPSVKVPGGWRWGKKGKVYPTKKQADRQGAAAYASGYKPKRKRKRARAKRQRS